MGKSRSKPSPPARPARRAGSRGPAANHSPRVPGGAPVPAANRPRQDAFPEALDPLPREGECGRAERAAGRQIPGLAGESSPGSPPEAGLPAVVRGEGLAACRGAGPRLSECVQAGTAAQARTTRSAAHPRVPPGEGRAQPARGAPRPVAMSTPRARRSPLVRRDSALPEVTMSPAERGGVRLRCRGAAAGSQSGARQAPGDSDSGREPPTCSRRPRPGRHHGASAARAAPVRSRR